MPYASPMIETDKIAGVVLGTAIGDALGYPVEFNKDRLPVKALAELVDKQARCALYSDDTQMFLATVEGLADALVANRWGVTDAAPFIAGHYVKWSKSPENNRAPGGACMYGCANLADGIAWDVAGKPHGKGCGAAMRSMAYSLFLEVDHAAQWAGEHALMTHRDASAQASAAAVAAGVRGALEDLGKFQIAALMVSAARVYDAETAMLLNRAVMDAQNNVSAEKVLDRWRGWRGDEAVAASLYCLLQTSGYADAVLLAVNSPGDSDSLGAITGALAGAKYGAAAIPGGWIEVIENRPMLVDVAIRQADFQRSGLLAATDRR